MNRLGKRSAAAKRRRGATNRRFRWTLALLALLGCNPESGDGIEGIGHADGGERDGGGEHDSGQHDGGDVHEGEPRGYAVIASDYTVTAVSLLDADGKVQKRAFVDSGSATAGLVTALSGDVVLPTRSGDPGVLTLIDRFRSNVITRIEIASGDVLGQIKTQAPNAQADENSFSSNPQDYVRIDASNAWVSRYDPNLNVPDDDPDKSVDLLRLDLAHEKRSDERIDFNAFNGMGERMNPDTGKSEKVAVYARPVRMVRLHDTLVVGIDSLSQTFDAAGKGMVAWVDLETQHVQVLELPGLLSCNQVVPVPDDDTHVAVACTGTYFDADPREHVGLAMLEFKDDKLTIERVWRASDDPDAALTRYGLIALSASEVLAAAAGDPDLLDDKGKLVTPGTNDVLYRVDLASGEQHSVFEASGQYVIGDGVFNAQRGILLVPDASIDKAGKPIAGVRRLQRDDAGDFKALDVIELDDILPVRQIAPLD